MTIRQKLAAACLAIAVLFAVMPSVAMAQAANPPATSLPAHNGPFLTGRVILLIKAGSKADAQQHARGLPNFGLDENYGPLDMHNGTYVVRGDKTGPISDATGAIVVEAPDALMTPF